MVTLVKESNAAQRNRANSIAMVGIPNGEELLSARLSRLLPELVGHLEGDLNSR